MKVAIFSDVHGNLEAYEAVMADIDLAKPDRLVCLGDMVGYGADSPACLDRVRALGCPIMRGNHDEEAAGRRDLDDYSPAARAGMQLAREQLSIEQKDFLRQLPYTLREPKVEFVHASLHEPESFHYILDGLSAHLNFLAQEADVSFHGHTHVPRVWFRDPEGFLSLACPEPEPHILEKGCVYAINVGSVGQPRDLDPRASYVIYDQDNGAVEFRRVEYNLQKAQLKIMQAGLPSMIANRLAMGR